MTFEMCVPSQDDYVLPCAYVSTWKRESRRSLSACFTPVNEYLTAAYARINARGRLGGRRTRRRSMPAEPRASSTHADGTKWTVQRARQLNCKCPRCPFDLESHLRETKVDTCRAVVHTNRCGANANEIKEHAARTRMHISCACLMLNTDACARARIARRYAPNAHLPA